MTNKVFAIKRAENQPNGVPDEFDYLGWAENDEEAQEMGASHFAVERQHVLVLEGKQRGEDCFFVDCPDRHDEDHDLSPR